MRLCCRGLCAGLIIILCTWYISASATEQYDFTVTLPVIDPTRPGVELRAMSFSSMYSPLETLVDAVTWDPCRAKGQGADCHLINPLHSANLRLRLHAYNADSIDNVDGCFVEMDLRHLKPLSMQLQMALGMGHAESGLLQLAAESLEQSTNKSDYYVDCEIRLTGSDQYLQGADVPLPKYINPVIPPCQRFTPSRRQQAIGLNDRGMNEYRAKNWARAAELFRQAAVQDCSYFVARTNLASVLSLQEKYEQAAAVLWRAVKMDPQRTMQKLEKDADYLGLKQDSNFYAASSPVGLVYRHYCYRPARPESIDENLPALIAQTRLKPYVKRYAVASRYTFESDFNGNGIPDRVYPLILNGLRDVLVVFDGDRVNVESCTSTPLHPRDLSPTFKHDPCDIQIRAVVDKNQKYGIVLKTRHVDVARAVCR